LKCAGDRRRAAIRSLAVLPLVARATDTQSYDNYLKGRFSLEKGNARKGIEYFQSAIHKHPDYALAYVGRANSYITLGHPWVGDMSPKEVLPQAKAAATKAWICSDVSGCLEKPYQTRFRIDWPDCLAVR
jgi:hypothetical protein